MLMVAVWIFALFLVLVFYFCSKKEYNVGLPIFFASFDDSDIKIAGDKPSQQIFKDNQEPQEDIAQLLHNERENGNLDKARELGKRVAVDLYNFSVNSGEYSKEIKQEMKVLYAFVIDYVLNNYLPNSIVSQTALSEYMTTLKNIDEDFYDHIQVSGSYSVYVLKSRKDIDLADKIGKSFAKVVDFDDDPSWVNIGSQLYNNWLAGLTEKINFYQFES